MFICDNLSDNNINYYIDKKKEYHHIIHFAFKNNNIYKYSSDFLNIRKNTCSNYFLNISKNIVLNNYNKNNIEYINDNVVSFISSFTCGTVHGYASIYEYIIYYIQNNLNKKIILSTMTQPGIVDIVSHFFDKKNIIFLKPDIIYNIKNITFIPLHYMHFEDIFWKKVDPFFKKHIINNKFNSDIKKIALMKTSSSNNNTITGIISIDNANIFCKNNNLYNLIPSNYNEIYTANLIHNCEIFVCTWGTAYYKNIRYIGEKCKNIYVLITNDFINQYDSRKNRLHSHVYKKYKNAIVKYIKISNICSLII